MNLSKTTHVAIYVTRSCLRSLIRCHRSHHSASLRSTPLCSALLAGSFIRSVTGKVATYERTSGIDIKIHPTVHRPFLKSGKAEMKKTELKGMSEGDVVSLAVFRSSRPRICNRSFPRNGGDQAITEMISMYISIVNEKKGDKMTSKIHYDE